MEISFAADLNTAVIKEETCKYNKHRRVVDTRVFKKEEIERDIRFTT